MYFHEKVENMVGMKAVYFTDASKAEHYFKNAHNRPHHQAINLEMEQNCDPKNLQNFNKLLNSHDDLEELRLSYYENKHLNESHFQAFMGSLAKQKHLRKLDVNLRWCE